MPLPTYYTPATLLDALNAPSQPKDGYFQKLYSPYELYIEYDSSLGGTKNIYFKVSPDLHKTIIPDEGSLKKLRRLLFEKTTKYIITKFLYPSRYPPLRRQLRVRNLQWRNQLVAKSPSATYPPTP